jgi:hypothetical protein
MLGQVFVNLCGTIGIAAGLSYVLGGLLLDLTYRTRPSLSPAREVCLPPSPPPWYFGVR